MRLVLLLVLSHGGIEGASDDLIEADDSSFARRGAASAAERVGDDCGLYFVYLWRVSAGDTLYSRRHAATEIGSTSGGGGLVPI
jgi:hypothetical protein